MIKTSDLQLQLLEIHINGASVVHRLLKVIILSFIKKIETVKHKTNSACMLFGFWKVLLKDHMKI